MNNDIKDQKPFDSDSQKGRFETFFVLPQTSIWKTNSPSSLIHTDTRTKHKEEKDRQRKREREGKRERERDLKTHKPDRRSRDRQTNKQRHKYKQKLTADRDNHTNTISFHYSLSLSPFSHHSCQSVCLSNHCVVTDCYPAKVIFQSYYDN